jgi:hypothetical protein
MCLKPSLLLWLAVLFTSRAVTLPIMIGIGHVAGVNTDAMTWLRDFWNADECVPALFSIPLLYSFCRRVPSASAPVRWLWSHGRILLALAAGLDLAMPVMLALWNREFSDQIMPSLFTAGIDVYLLTYVLAARRVRDTFLEFPPPLDYSRQKSPGR